ncbi:uncharacterized protein [Coffea arabica]|uniref:TRF2/HOY1 PH-like domain-containing protein n=1 Tax=Coffea arabica TaxID=13443 RepID=A0A6P6VHJ2_COFAR|nr:uncharacterized protein LOC113723722 [Coffea arabica]
MLVEDDNENGPFSSPEESYQNPPLFTYVDLGFGSSGESSSKRIKLSLPNQQQEEKIDTSEESGGLGLKLSKSPSLISLLEMKLSKRRQTKNTCSKLAKKPTSKPDDIGSQSNAEKLKASNFPALSIKIGTWERHSMHEGHLVAKCYYAKRKLVWEVLEGALKSKIEILWSDIVGIRATIIDDQPGVLEVELHQPPTFFKETNPQPRKHTLWQQASDFTGGQAPICRRHRVKFAPGILDKHYEKLKQCDPRLQVLSRRPFPSQESLYFDANNANGLSEFSLDFNGYGPQFLAGLMQFPSYSSHPSLPIHLRQAALPRLMDSNIQMSVNDLIMLENHRRALLSEANLAKLANQIHLPGGPAVTPVGYDFSSHLANAMALGELRRKSNEFSSVGLLNFNNIENHLLVDNAQMVSSSSSSSSDENSIVARVKSMYPFLDLEQIMQGNPTISRGLVGYPESADGAWQEIDEGMATSTSNNSPRPYALAAYPMTEEFSTLALNQDI